MALNKYRNKKTTLAFAGNDYVFDSKAEAARGRALLLLQLGEAISNLEFQPVFVLQEGFRRNGKKHREIKYISDFRYIDNEGNEVVEDVKGRRTTEYMLKRKMFLKKFNIKFIEVYVKRGKFEIKEF